MYINSPCTYFVGDYVVAAMLQAATSLKSAGKRGRAWKCIPCGFTGEKLAVTKHVYVQHFTADDFPFTCSLCGFAHFHWATYAKHGKWYSLHQTLAVGDTRSIEEVTVTKPAPEHLPTMFVQLSVPESVEHWASRKRDGPVSSAPPTTAVISASTAVIPATTASSSPVEPASTVSVPPSAPSTCTDPLPLPPLATSPPPPLVDIPGVLDQEERDLMDEFLIREPVRPERKTTSTNTDPLEEVGEIQRLRKIIERQERALEANTTAIHLLQKALEARGFEPPPVQGTYHHRGPGNGEAPHLTYRPRPAPAPAPKLHSVVVVKPKAPVIHNRKSFHRSPLQNLFVPDNGWNRRGRSPRRSPPRNNPPPRRSHTHPRRSRSPVKRK